MITNLIYFLYNIKVEYVRKNRENYIFFYNNNFYIFKECFINEDYLKKIYIYLNNSIYYHEVIKNRKNRYISVYNNISYILMRVRFNSNRLLLFEDIYNMNNYHITYIKKEQFNWISLWKAKIDQIEYIINSNFNKFNISTVAIINYYLGLSEIAISIIDSNINNDEIIPLSICHRRVRNDFDLYEYYDITDLVIDHYTRDLGEYIKSEIISNKFEIGKYKIINNLSRVDKILLLARVIFPSYFYDVFDNFVFNEKEFIDFDKSFIEIDKYESNIKELVSFITK